MVFPRDLRSIRGYCYTSVVVFSREARPLFLSVLASLDLKSLILLFGDAKNVKVRAVGILLTLTHNV